MVLKLKKFGQMTQLRLAYNCLTPKNSSILTHWELLRQGEGVVARERLEGPWRQTPQVCLQTGRQSQRLWLSSPGPHWTTWKGERVGAKEREEVKGEGGRGLRQGETAVQRCHEKERKKILKKVRQKAKKKAICPLCTCLCAHAPVCASVRLYTTFMCVSFMSMHIYL